MSDIIFYDSDCSFCLFCICQVIRWDKKERFLFKSLGEEKSTLILEEKDGRRWTEAKAVFRIFWLLGGFWKILGLLHYLPGFLINPFYRQVAKNRHLLKRFKPDPQILTENKQRFLS